MEGKALDGVEGGDNGVLYLHDGKIHGGTSFFYIIGSLLGRQVGRVK
jgi:hypothetical protein